MLRALCHLQSHHTGHSTREMRQASSKRVRGYQDNTDQPIASSSRRLATKDHVLPVEVVLHPRRWPYFYERGDNDVHVWTSIIDRYLGTIWGEPSTQLTNIGSVLRGAAFEWYSSFEMCTKYPSDWTILHHAILERFGLSIRAEKADAALIHLKRIGGRRPKMDFVK